MKKRKGIILAGGTGSRLFPITHALCKQLLPVYDKPMIYYPLTSLMLANIRDILIITKECDLDIFQNLLGDGKQFGINITYKIQTRPRGIADALILGEEFLDNSPSALILGDNLFFGNNFVTQLENADKNEEITLFAYLVKDPERYGVVQFDNNKNIIDIEEKPTNPKTRFAITGIYFYDSSASEKAKSLKPSPRDELEITDLNRIYLNEKNLKIELLGRGIAWLDTGTVDSLHEAGSYIRTVENRQGLKIGCPEEVAWRKGWIDSSKLKFLANSLLKSGYGEYLLDLMKNEL